MLPRWNPISTQLRFIYNWVNTRLQWMVCWWLLVHSQWVGMWSPNQLENYRYVIHNPKLKQEGYLGTFWQLISLGIDIVRFLPFLLWRWHCNSKLGIKLLIGWLRVQEYRVPHWCMFDYPSRLVFTLGIFVLGTLCLTDKLIILTSPWQDLDYVYWIKRSLMFLYVASLSLHFVVLDVRVRFAAQPSKDTLFFNWFFLFMCR
jgi:hypothetical protein